MLQSKTVLVVGAGAGAEIGMPVGSELSTTIAAKTDIKFQHGMQQTSGDGQVTAGLRRAAKLRNEDFNTWRAEACSIKEGIHYTRSIDAYLHTHRENEKVKVAAKLAIVQSILEAERRSAVLRTDRDKWQGANEVLQSWLPDLLYVLQDGVAASGNLAQLFSNLRIVNFNYDRCIENFFFYALQDLFRKNEIQAAEALSELKIFHPYGQVGHLPWQLANPEGRRVGFGVVDYRDVNGLAEEIRTFNEQVEDQGLTKRMGAAINGAERIIFLGFHFHGQNMQLMTTNAKASEGWSRPTIYGTVMARSGPEVSMIQQRISSMLGEFRPPLGVHLADFGCKRFFTEYAATWM